MTCKHERRTDFGMKHSEHPHEYCPDCGWHRYCGKEYTREEWAIAFIEEKKEVIQNKMIRYGTSRYGRSCGNCVYREQHPARGSVCVLCDETTKLDQCCGQWGGEIVPEPVEENQGELF